VEVSGHGWFGSQPLIATHTTAAVLRTESTEVLRIRSTNPASHGGVARVARVARVQRQEPVDQASRNRPAEVPGASDARHSSNCGPGPPTADCIECAVDRVRRTWWIFDRILNSPRVGQLIGIVARMLMSRPQTR